MNRKYWNNIDILFLKIKILINQEVIIYTIYRIIKIKGIYYSWSIQV